MCTTMQYASFIKKTTKNCITCTLYMLLLGIIDIIIISHEQHEYKTLIKPFDVIKTM